MTLKLAFSKCAMSVIAEDINWYFIYLFIYFWGDIFVILLTTCFYKVLSVNLMKLRSLVLNCNSANRLILFSAFEWALVIFYHDTLYPVLVPMQVYWHRPWFGLVFYSYNLFLYLHSVIKIYHNEDWILTCMNQKTRWNYVLNLHLLHLLL